LFAEKTISMPIRIILASCYKDLSFITEGYFWSRIDPTCDKRNYRKGWKQLPVLIKKTTGIYMEVSVYDSDMKQKER